MFKKFLSALLCTTFICANAFAAATPAVTLEVLGGRWSSNIAQTTTLTIENGEYEKLADTNKDDIQYPIKNLHNNYGQSLFYVSCTAPVDGLTVKFRTSSGSEFTLESKKQEDNTYLYEGYFDLATLPRYYERTGNKSKVDRFNAEWWFFVQNKTGSTVTVDNINIQRMTTNSDPNRVYAKLTAKNESASENAGFSGVVILAKYDANNTLVNIKTLDVDWKESYDINDTGTKVTVSDLAPGATRYANLLLEDKNYNNACTYKAFCWDSFNRLVPLTPMDDMPATVE